ncbi:uncharacterized protein SAPINGB_P003471 [Magnusiomyces paraingens]|uniref:Uncharacterized protein n=1 Tax=Magnusiomyces paraingens TaxID=2606893 RepID=A0A5E8BWZ6_9ASCO|nr:uncharacterized protein SAPINGB_P003471 [Saprochaete ingens]VVT53235.1 unnamed protein product [Saprochaete ingens]
MSTLYSSCPLSENGIPLIKWIHVVSHECVYGNLEAFSWASQYISILVWVTAGTYQSYQLYKTKDVNGFSEGFVLCWIAGAFLNVLGCLCTGQMPFQVVLGFYFLFSDSFLYFQYKYYSNRPWLAVQQLEEDSQVMEERQILIPSSSNTNKPRQSSISKNDTATITRSYSTFTPGVVLGLAYGSSTTSGAPLPSVIASTAASASPSQILLILATVQLIVGNIASWTSNALYTVSRLPQIKRNFDRKSCEGVSPALFIATLFGNVSYCFTIGCTWKSIVDPVEAREFFITEFPFIFGAVSTTVADIIIFIQFYIYRDNEYETLQNIDYNAEERIMVIESRSLSDEDEEPYARGPSSSRKTTYYSKN